MWGVIYFIRLDYMLLARVVVISLKMLSFSSK